MTDQSIEQEIQAKGKTAPRITPADIDSAIISETFTVLPSRKVMVCELTLRNGFTVRGEAATVSKANFDHEIGMRISRDNARNKVWELEGYLLQQRLHEQSNDFPLGKACDLSGEGTCEACQ
jgi:exopolyphosphatase/pppGpp-phosphohydrolase